MTVNVQLKQALSGSGLLAEVEVSSTFSLPVERGWARDVLQPADVAENMRDVLADRLPRWASAHWGLELKRAPLQRRGVEAWPTADSEAAPAAISWRYLPLVDLVELRLLEGTTAGERVFSLGGWCCAGSDCVRGTVACTALKVVEKKCGDGVDEDEERLDLRLITRITDLPVAGRQWGLLGLTGKWWWELVRLPPLKTTLEDFHQMAHEHMMLFYIAALRTSDPPPVQ